MQRNDERRDDDLIDLGSAIAETQGDGKFTDDVDVGQLIPMGLSRE
jgi:hypothetical protein